jgi:hypothetical protein
MNLCRHPQTALRRVLFQTTPTRSSRPLRAFTPSSFAIEQRALKSCQSDQSEAKSPCGRKSETTSPPPTTSQFWTSPSVWRRAAVNTFRCLVGCTAGDFASMWYLQAFHPELGIPTIMMISSTSTSESEPCRHVLFCWLSTCDN